MIMKLIDHSGVRSAPEPHPPIENQGIGEVPHAHVICSIERIGGEGQAVVDSKAVIGQEGLLDLGRIDVSQYRLRL